MFITGFLISTSKMGIAGFVCVAECRASVKALSNTWQETRGKRAPLTPVLLMGFFYGQVCSELFPGEKSDVFMLHGVYYTTFT